MSQLPLNPPRLTPDARTYLKNVAQDWYNNYLSTEIFGEHNGLTFSQARVLLSLAIEVNNSPHPEE
jgi:hypothetical protein